jgi:hypothetical protein
MANINDIEVLDNFLLEKEFKNLENIIESDTFNWFFKRSTAKERVIEDVDKFMFSHVLYHPSNNIGSVFLKNFEIIPIKLAEKYGFTKTMRMKLNLYPNQKKRVYHEFHYDMNDKNQNPKKGFVSAIFNFTTCNGGTIINNKAFTSKSNQVILFPNEMKHCGFTATDVQARIVLNIVLE